MQEQTQTQLNQNLVATSLAEQAQDAAAGTPQDTAAMNDNFIRKISEKVDRSDNILVTLSRNPSVDEMVAAIGLTMFLDDLQKHTTAIYSGETPNALNFLRPQNTFESNTDSLQDFIIALNKEKADHLRYKLEGDFVKIYITPYKTVITEKDLQFSRGDYNVDLVIALGVPSAGDLDEALSEYGRIMHNAVTVDITIGAPGRFGEIEWSNPMASSVSEMVTKLIFAMDEEQARVNKDIATALLTGIVAATGRFSNDRTTSDTLELASRLMSMGADQQLISSHVMDNHLRIDGKAESATVKPKEDATNLMVEHDEEHLDAAAPVVQPEAPAPGSQDQVTAENQARAAMASAASQAVQEAMSGITAEATPAAPVTPAPVATSPSSGPVGNAIVPPANPEPPQPPKDYAKMIDEALAEPGGVAPVQVGAVASGNVGTQPVVPESASNVNLETGAVANGQVGNSQPMQAPQASLAGQGLGAPDPNMIAPVGNSQPDVGLGAPIVPLDNTQAAPASQSPAAGASLEMPPMNLPGAPVENPNSVVLPPPPVPSMGGEMMPPA